MANNTDKEKLAAILALFKGVDMADLTYLELRVKSIVTGYPLSSDELEHAKKNSKCLLDNLE